MSTLNIDWKQDKNDYYYYHKNNIDINSLD